MPKVAIEILGLIVLTILTGTLFYHAVEGWRFLDALYFSVATLTTVGYGDFTPQTDAGKIFTIFYILFGVGIIFTALMSFGEHTHKRVQERHGSRDI